MSVLIRPPEEVVFRATQETKEWADQQLNPPTGPEKKEYALNLVLKWAEEHDNFIPGIGKYMDMPIIDGLEKLLLGVAIDRVYYIFRSIINK